MLRASQQGRAGSSYYVHLKAGICYVELTRSTTCVPIRMLPKESPRKWKDPVLEIIFLHYVTQGEPVRRPWWIPAILWAFGVAFFKPNTYGCYCLDRD